MYGRFAAGLRPFLLDTISLDDARRLVRSYLAEREENFLRVVKRAVFEYAKSPYLPLLQRAGVGYEDVEATVRERGLEGALTALREAGVYVTFEECKGRVPMVRDGREFPVTERDFDNPWMKTQFYSESGGSTGAGTRVQHELDHLAAIAAHEMVTYHANGAHDVPRAVWRGVLPDGSGIDNILRGAHYGVYYERWFSHTLPQDYNRSLLKFRLATQFAVAIARAYRVPLPWPERVHLNEAHVVAHWMREKLDREGTCLLSVAASRALRVCVAARNEGIDLTGAIFRVAGEPLSPAKARGIEETGARIFTTYGFSEIGRVGMGCANPCEPNDLHLVRGLCGMIQYDRLVPASGQTVPAFYFTSILPTAPKILLNAESDDYGIVEERACGCPLEELGLVEHVRRIRSFAKMTGEGVTLVGSDAVHILEEVLPAKYGGSPLDYQMVESEGEDGFTRLELRVSPRIDVADESEVVGVVLDALRERNPGADQAQSVWREANALQVKRAEPVWTARGKFKSLHVDKTSRPGE
jgi:hypothetical protein